MMQISDSLPYNITLWHRMKSLFFFILRMGYDDNGVVNSLELEKEFSKIISQERALISKICFSFADSVEDFEDLQQDAIINIWRGLKNYRGEATLKTWIYRITLNTCLSTVRKQSRHKHESLEKLYGLIDSDYNNREEIELIHAIINRLNNRDKAIIMMWLDELTYEEIAQNMGMNRNTVATLIRRIKENISKQFKDYSYE